MRKALESYRGKPGSPCGGGPPCSLWAHHQAPGGNEAGRGLPRTGSQSCPSGQRNLSSWHSANSPGGSEAGGSLMLPASGAPRVHCDRADCPHRCHRAGAKARLTRPCWPSPAPSSGAAPDPVPASCAGAIGVGGGPPAGMPGRQTQDGSLAPSKLHPSGRACTPMRAPCGGLLRRPAPEGDSAGQDSARLPPSRRRSCLLPNMENK